MIIHLPLVHEQDSKQLNVQGVAVTGVNWHCSSLSPDCSAGRPLCKQTERTLPLEGYCLALYSAAPVGASGWTRGHAHFCHLCSGPPSLAVSSYPLFPVHPMDTTSRNAATVMLA